MPAVHAGQADIADQQVDALGRIEYRHRAIAITGFDEGITQIAQHRADQHPHRRIVLDDQYRLAIVGEGRVSDIDRMLLRQITPEAWQKQTHRGAFADYAVDDDMTA
ncbi:hypothetical protein D3C76_1086110 [compost metagenome]